MVCLGTERLTQGDGIYNIEDKATGLKGVIAIDSTTLGPAAGGCRLWSYATNAEATADAVRLARGMTYKNALADLPFGGGKAVLQMPPAPFDRKAMFRAFGAAVQELGGQYVTAEDVGTNVRDMEAVREKTSYVAGLTTQSGMAGGDPSPWTSLGIFLSMQEAARSVLNRELSQVKVAIQGTGSVGGGLARLLHKAGAKLVLADPCRERVEALARELGAIIVDPLDIIQAEADVFAPCAMGGSISKQTIPHLRATVVCGGANNQLADGDVGDELLRRAIAYMPDYLVNAGGIISVSAEYLGETREQVAERVAKIPERLRAVLGLAANAARSPHHIADEMVQAKLHSRDRESAAS